MTDSLSDSIDAAEREATVLDDQMVVENAAVYRWLRAHEVRSRRYPHLVFGDQPLPPAWRAQVVSFGNQGVAHQFLQPFKADPYAMSILRRLGSPPVQGGESDDAVLTRLSFGLVRREIWALTPKPVQNSMVGKTDAAVFDALNPRFGTNIDFAAIAKLEGGQWRRGYVPMSRGGVVIGASGMTIASGFDIGQWGEPDLRRMGLADTLIVKLKPFCQHSFKGKTKAQVAKLVAELGAVPEISKADADQIDGAVFAEILRSAIADWDRLRSADVPGFKSMPGAWQTVWLSRNYQEGRRPRSGSAIAFRKAAVEGRWTDAIRQLRGYSEYTERANAEADTLGRQVPPPVMRAPSPPGVPGSQFPLTGPQIRLP